MTTENSLHKIPHQYFLLLKITNNILYEKEVCFNQYLRKIFPEIYSASV